MNHSANRKFLEFLRHAELKPRGFWHEKQYYLTEAKITAVVRSLLTLGLEGRTRSEIGTKLKKKRMCKEKRRRKRRHKKV